MANTPEKKTPLMDPMDTVLATLGSLGVLSIAAGTIWKGSAKYLASAWVSIVTAAYVTAPARKFPTAEEITEGIDLSGKVALVTGSTSGIGIDTARVLALRGAKVYLVARNAQKLVTVKQQILDSNPSAELETLVCDLSDLDSVKTCATSFLKMESRLDTLVNNAGIMAVQTRQATKQDLEQQVGICHVAHFYLTKLLLPALQKAGTNETPSRVVTLSSSAHRRHHIVDCLKSPTLETEPYDPWVAYGNAKVSNLLFAKGLNDRYDNIDSFSVMPGGINTGLQKHISKYVAFKYSIFAPFFFKTTSQGAATSLLCATKADQAGEYYDNCKPTEALKSVLDEAGGDAVQQLWDRTEALLTKLGY